MKNLFYLTLSILFSIPLLGQSPNAFKYQAVARNSSGEVIANTEMGIKISIIQTTIDGTAVYEETFDVTTNDFGLINLNIGNGTVVNGDFESINWGAGPYFVKVELDVNDGNGFVEMGTSQLMSVPYALHAKTAENTFSGDYNDLSNAPDLSMFDTDITDDFSGNYYDLDNLPNWRDSIDLKETFSGNYYDLDNLPDWKDSIDSKIAFSGNYYDLDNLPNWTDSINMKTDSAIIVAGPLEINNLISYDGNNWVAKDIVLGNTGGNIPINNMQPSIVLNYCIALQGVFPSRNILDPFLGTIVAFGFNFPPRGWATCDGQLMAIAQNSALFALLGTIYGGDGRTTFALPDLRGRVPIHRGQGPGLTDRRQGVKFGSETTTISVINLPSHTHSITFE